MLNDFSMEEELYSLAIGNSRCRETNLKLHLKQPYWYMQMMCCCSSVGRGMLRLFQSLYNCLKEYHQGKSEAMWVGQDWGTRVPQVPRSL